MPVNGSRAAKPALELATQLSANLGTQLLQLHVSPDPAGRLSGRGQERSRQRAILDEAASVAGVGGARASSVLTHGDSPAEGILNTAEEVDADLIIMSGSSRANDGVAALSATIERVLDETETTLVVVLVPEESGAAGSGDDHD